MRHKRLDFFSNASLIHCYPIKCRIKTYLPPLTLMTKRIFPVQLLFEPMVLSVMYVWCQMNREAVVQFWFGTQFKAIYFPWALVVFNIIIRGSALMELVGIFVGHVYYFFAHQYPQEFGGPQILKTPGFL
ncbi:unnamed protein product [Dibothriocephalus latus]|uniref:Derlin n=1 Tax=Dibothriocephalus latus TaxID=60516 RepID=A0A3P7PFT2_DIBLA|nr:unnamed protein product [Dibothriocephalus latus]